MFRLFRKPEPIQLDDEMTAAVNALDLDNAVIKKAVLVEGDYQGQRVRVFATGGMICMMGKDTRALWTGKAHKWLFYEEK